jgi:integrase
MSASINAYFKEAGINATAYQCRHSFGTEIYASSKDIRVTQVLMGHASPATTAGYIASSHIDAAEAVGSLKLSG